MDISVRIDDRQVQALLDRLSAKVGNMKPTMTRIGALYERRVGENFANENAPDGSKWTPLAQDTLMMGLGKNKGFKKNGGLSARGKRYLTGKKMLWEKGDLSGSIHFQADAQSVTIGSSGSIPYAAIHQMGGQAGRGKKVTIPARPYLAMNRDKNLELAEVDRQWIMDLIREEMMDGK
jgi:phage virion morphogenesis protein